MVIRSRGTGALATVVGLLILASYYMAPVPDFDGLELRRGLVTDVTRERTLCRHFSSDCSRTVVEIDHAGETRSYNFAQTGVDAVQEDAPIDIWVASAIRGVDLPRVWHATQNGEVLRDYESQASTDRYIMWGLLPVALVLLLGGLWIFRRYDWAGGSANQ